VTYPDCINKEPFCYLDVLFRRRFVTGDIMLRRRSVKETFCMETFCRGDVLCRHVLYVRPNNIDKSYRQVLSFSKFR
jgi:hypothetical protein